MVGGLELVGGKFKLDRLAGMDEADVLVGGPHFGSEDFAVGDEGHQDGAGADDGAVGVGGEVFDYAHPPGAGRGGIERATPVNRFFQRLARTFAPCEIVVFVGCCFLCRRNHNPCVGIKQYVELHR